MLLSIGEPHAPASICTGGHVRPGIGQPGGDLVRTTPTLAEFIERPGLTGMPLLAPFANRLDQTGFYANGKKYNFDMELGNVRGPIPGTGFVNNNTSRGWQLVEYKADAQGAWVTCKLDFYLARQVRADRRCLYRSGARRERTRDDEADVQRQGAARDARTEIQDRADVVDSVECRRWPRRRPGPGRSTGRRRRQSWRSSARGSIRAIRAVSGGSGQRS